jgi:hypothetical protein
MTAEAQDQQPPANGMAVARTAFPGAGAMPGACIFALMATTAMLSIAGAG